MKTILLILLNLQLVYGTTFNNTSSVYGRSRDIPTSECRIGYTTQYGDGFNRNSTFGYPQNTYVNHKSTFGYTTGGSSGSGRPGQPRRVKGYTDDGQEHDDGGSPYSDWAPLVGTSYFEGQNGIYYWDDKTNSWWRYDGSKWHKWMSTFDYYHWSIFEYGGPSNPEKGYNKDNPVPIGDPPFFVILGLLFLWMTYDIFIKLMIKKDKK